MSANVSLSTSLSKNLYSLQTTQKLMEESEYKLTTGKKVNSALDDPISYFVSQEHLQRSTDLQTLKDSMSEAIQTITAADDGISSIEDMITDAKSLAQSALSADDEDESQGYMDQFNALLEQIDSIAEDSGYGGVNLLGGTTQTLEVDFNEDGSSTITLTGIDASTASTGLNVTEVETGNAWYSGTEAGGDFAVGTANINASIAELDAAKSELRTASKTLANKLSTIETRQTFTDNLINTLEDGSANLVNCDTTKESVTLTTLQTQQSLAITSLGISNSQSQAVLSLFQ